MSDDSLLARVRFNEQGLVAAIAQDADSGEVLMMAWMNAEALRLTVELGYAVYYSRSRQALWRKGERSGHVQRLRSLHCDCDGDTILLRVEQVGGIACHTGRANCFYWRWDASAQSWQDSLPVLRDPKELYHE